MNLYNRMPGKEVVILGSGDIGMIMARRMTLEGAHVQAVFELMPYPSGLPRNIVQCLDDYNIPLYLSHTVTEIHGRDRLTGVTISEVDANRRPIPGTEKEYKCDTLILSVGLIPENKLLEDAGIAIDPHTNGAVVDENLQTNVPGVFSAGNVLHVHDLVDFVSMESEALARHAAAYVEGKGIAPCTLDVKCGEGVGHTIPQKVSGKNDFSLSLRVRNHYRDCRIVVRQNGVEVAAKKMKKAIPKWSGDLGHRSHLPPRRTVCPSGADCAPPHHRQLSAGQGRRAACYQRAPDQGRPQGYDLPGDGRDPQGGADRPRQGRHHRAAQRLRAGQ